MIEILKQFTIKSTLLHNILLLNAYDDPDSTVTNMAKYAKKTYWTVLNTLDDFTADFCIAAELFPNILETDSSRFRPNSCLFKIPSGYGNFDFLVVHSIIRVMIR